MGTFAASSSVAGSGVFAAAGDALSVQPVSSIAGGGGGGILKIAAGSSGSSRARGNSAKSFSKEVGSAITDTAKKPVVVMIETPPKKARGAPSNSFQGSKVATVIQADGGRQDSRTVQVNHDFAGMPILDMSPLKMAVSPSAKRMRVAVPTLTRRVGRRELFCVRAAPEPCKDTLCARVRLSRDEASSEPLALALGPAGDKAPPQGAVGSISGASAGDKTAPAADAKAPATSIFGTSASDAKASSSSIFGAIGATGGSTSAGASSGPQSIFGASSSGSKAPTQSLFGAVAADSKASQGLFGPPLAQPSGQPSIFAQAPAQPKARGNARRRGR